MVHWNSATDSQFMVTMPIYAGFLKWGYPDIIHVIFGFSINHPAIGVITQIYGNTHRSRIT
jgi:hypothetical protein